MQWVDIFIFFLVRSVGKVFGCFVNY